MSQVQETATVRDRLREDAKTILWPITALAREGKYERTRKFSLDAPGVGLAIAQALDCQVESVELVCVPRPFDDAEIGLQLGDKVDFVESLAIRLGTAYSREINRRGELAFGNDAWRRKQDEIWNYLRLEIGMRLGMAFWDDPWEAPKNAPGENLITLMFYLLSLAEIEDADGIARLTPLARLMSYAIPLGEIRGKPGHWLVVLAPSPKQNGN